MTTLNLDVALEHPGQRELHQWLSGDWALMFSNPEDFQPSAKHKERWLDGLRYEFNARSLRVLAVSRDGRPNRTWIHELSMSDELICLREPAFVAGDGVSFAKRALRGELLTMTSRFVMFIDGTLKRRELLKYSAGRQSLSVPDLLVAVDAARTRKLASKAA